jgi:DNA (cytosine-5)-methyltransferase 1
MNDVTAITLFAGAGGWDLGFAACGVPILAALNHNERSLATHALNFPDTEQVKTDITQDDPRCFPHATILQASPECTNHSSARGVKLKGQNQPGLWTDREEDDPATRSRATMREVARWTSAKKAQGHPFQLVYVENVTKVHLWGGYHAWLAEMHALGYQSKTLYLNSMFAPAFPAPCYESRDRWYTVFWLEGNRAPDLEINPPAHCTYCDRQIAALQSWKNPRRRYGDYGKQYLYRCPRCLQEVIPFYRPASEMLDWALPVPLIGQRRRPLVPETMAKLRRGLERYHSAHRAFLYSYYKNAVYRPLSDPVGTCTTKPRHALITIPHPAASVEECGYRMFTLEEYQRAMGFPLTFRFRCSQAETLRQLGLAVTPAVAALLVQRGLASLGYQQDCEGAA